MNLLSFRCELADEVGGWAVSSTCTAHFAAADRGGTVAALCTLPEAGDPAGRPARFDEVIDDVVGERRGKPGVAHSAWAGSVLLKAPYSACHHPRLRVVLEADIQACFDTVDHRVLMGRIGLRISDKKVPALVKAFLQAGVMTTTGERADTLTGTPQGGILSPLLANIALNVLHEHFAQHWSGDGCPAGGGWRHGVGRPERCAEDDLSRLLCRRGERGLWVPETRCTSCDLLILVE